LGPVANHRHDRRLKAEKARIEHHDAIEMEREAREMKSKAIVVTCGSCGATNLVEPNGVPKVQCTGCSKILVVRQPAQPRMESR